MAAEVEIGEPQIAPDVRPLLPGIERQRARQRGRAQRRLQARRDTGPASAVTVLVRLSAPESRRAHCLLAQPGGDGLGRGGLEPDAPVEGDAPVDAHRPVVRRLDRPSCEPARHARGLCLQQHGTQWRQGAVERQRLVVEDQAALGLHGAGDAAEGEIGIEGAHLVAHPAALVDVAQGPVDDPHVLQAQLVEHRLGAGPGRGRRTPVADARPPAPGQASMGRPRVPSCAGRARRP